MEHLPQSNSEAPSVMVTAVTVILVLMVQGVAAGKNSINIMTSVPIASKRHLESYGYKGRCESHVTLHSQCLHMDSSITGSGRGSTVPFSVVGTNSTELTK